MMSLIPLGHLFDSEEYVGFPTLCLFMVQLSILTNYEAFQWLKNTQYHQS